MKRLITLAFGVSLLLNVQAQMHFEVGIKGMFGPTFMFNKNISDDGEFDYKLASGNAFGAKFGVNFNPNHSVSFDFMRATSHHEFDSEPTDVFEWAHNDLILLYRYTGSGAFVEFGPKISLVGDVERNLGAGAMDISEFFNDQYTSLVFGFGSFLAGSDLVTLQIAARLHYALTDMLSESGEAINYPSGKAYPDYTPTRGLAAQIGFELNYAFGRFAKSNCSDRRRLILFR